MLSICFYFQVHQPYRLRKYTVFDINHNHNYYDEEKNTNILRKVAYKCYIPTNKLLKELLDQHPTFKISFSFSGVVLEQLALYCPEALESFQELIATGRVEVLAETYYHSLAFLYSQKEFKAQIDLHTKKIQQLFGVTPQVLRNTELIFNNDLALFAQSHGFIGALAEGADKVLEWRSPNFLYKSTSAAIPLLLKNYRLSDDIAFRFSERSWADHPLTVEKFVQWINAIHGNGNNVNLFMDYETFGEHQWESSGIFEFLRHLPREILKHPDNEFSTPSDLIQKYKPVAELDIPYFISWADVERDLSAWLGNQIQQFAITKLYELEQAIKEIRDEALLRDWRLLQTSDHFYYMCTKWFNDGDVHKYFNPYESPYEGFIYFMNVLNDIKQRIDVSVERKDTFMTKALSSHQAFLD